MILGIDHIALSTDDVETGVHALRALGYEAKFIARELPNPREKEGVQRHRAATHDLAYCVRRGSMAIELTRHHDDLAASQPMYQPIWRGAWPELISGPDPVEHTQSMLELPAWGTLSSVALGPFHTWCWRSYSEGEEGIVGLAVPLLEPAKSLGFWTDGLGCVPTGASTRETWQLQLRSVVPTWSLDLALVRRDDRNMPFIDDAGFNCLAILTSDLGQDLEGLLQHGGTAASEPFSLAPNKAPVRVAFVRGPNSELVELVQAGGQAQ